MRFVSIVTHTRPEYEDEKTEFSNMIRGVKMKWVTKTEKWQVCDLGGLNLKCCCMLLLSPKLT